MFATAISRPRRQSQSKAFHDSQYTASSGLSSNHTVIPPQSYCHSDASNDRTSPSDNPYSRCRLSTDEARDTGSSLVSEQVVDGSILINSELSTSETAYRQPSNSPILPMLSGMARTKQVKGPTLGFERSSTTTQPRPPDESESAVSPSMASSSDSGYLAPNLSLPAQERILHSLKPKKRREKPRIELAADQPPTTQGKPRARVYVACVQWCVVVLTYARLVVYDFSSRTRKIRCDGAKPVCHNCGRRTTGDNECSYDAIPKRRGPDKTPGARQRVARDVRNQLTGALLGKRRRRTRGTPPPGPNTTVRYGSSLSPSSPSPETTIALPVPLAIPSAVDTGILEAYGASSPVVSRTCLCHGLSSCPGLLGTDGFADGHEVPHMVSEESYPWSSV